MIAVMGPLRDIWRKRSRVQKIGLVAGAVIIVGVVGAVIVDNATMDGSGSESSRCVSVDESVVDAIAAGLGSPGDSLRNAHAVRSNDYEQLYFVAAQMDTSVYAEAIVGIWATDRIDDVGGMIFSANTAAGNFTDWDFYTPPVDDATPGLDGWSEAEACVMAAG
jgi:hypothetical protein